MKMSLTLNAKYACDKDSYLKSLLALHNQIVV